jgi:myosin heavy subunit
LSSHLNRTSIETADLKGRYDQLLQSHNELEVVVSEEQSARISAENRLKSLEQTNERIVMENREYQWKLESANSKLEQCNREISQAAGQLSELSEEVANMASMREQVHFAETEKSVLKRDIVRLLRLLEHFPAGKGYLKQWQDSEGMSFVGSAVDAKRHTSGEYKINFDKDDSESRNDPEVSPQELTHLKRTYNVELDTHMMFPTMEVDYRQLLCRLQLQFYRKNWTTGLPATL